MLNVSLIKENEKCLDLTNPSSFFSCYFCACFVSHHLYLCCVPAPDPHPNPRQGVARVPQRLLRPLW